MYTPGKFYITFYNGRQILLLPARGRKNTQKLDWVMTWCCYLLLMRNVLTRTGPAHVHTPTQTHDLHSTAKLEAVYNCRELSQDQKCDSLCRHVDGLYILVISCLCVLLVVCAILCVNETVVSLLWAGQCNSGSLYFLFHHRASPCPWERRLPILTHQRWTEGSPACMCVWVYEPYAYTPHCATFNLSYKFPTIAGTIYPCCFLLLFSSFLSVLEFFSHPNPYMGIDFIFMSQVGHIHVFMCVCVCMCVLARQ